MFSGDQSFSRDRQLDLMGDEWGRIRYPFWGFLVPTGFKSGFALKTVWFIPVFPVYSGFPVFMVFSVFCGFFGFWGKPDGDLGPSAPGEYQPLWPPDLDEGSTTGHLWRGLTGGEVRNMCHISRGRYEP